MKENNKLVRSKVPEMLKEKGYKLKGRKLDSATYKAKLHKLFLHEYKETLSKTNLTYTQVHYADMLEVIRTLRIQNQAKVCNVEELQFMEWYESFTPHLQKLKESRTDLLAKFYELLGIKNEEVAQDQLTELTNSFKKLVLASGLEPAQIERLRKDRLAKLGGFNGVYLEKVSRVVKVEHSV